MCVCVCVCVCVCKHKRQYTVVFQNSGSGIRLCGFKSQLHILLANYLTPLGHCILISGSEIIAFVSQGHTEK